MKTSEFKAILAIAVGNEIEAYQFYKDTASKAKNSSLKSLFNELAAEEANHKTFLEGILKNELKTLKFKETEDYKISESVPLPKLTTDMKYSDAIVLAMKKEQEAMEMYKKFADFSANDEQKKTFLELSKMEKGHKAKLENMYNDTAFVEVW